MPGHARMTIFETAPGEFEVTGEIDAHTAPSLADRVGQHDADRLVIDMSEVSFMDSSGLRVLVDLRQRSVDGGPTLTIRRPSRPIVRLLDLAGLTDQFNIDPSRSS